MRTLPLLGLGLAVLVGGLAACAGWKPRLASEAIAEEPAGTPAFSLLLTADNEGFIAPCGCEASQFGGFPRRATYLARTARAGDLRVDLGNLVLRQSPVRKIALEAALEGLAAQHYDVLVPGQSEFLVGEDFTKALAKAPTLHVVCANVRRANGTLLFDPWHLHTLPDGRVVALVGVIEPFAGAPADIRVDPPEAALHRLLSQFPAQFDAVIIAGSMRDETARAIAERLPGVALVAGGFTQRGSSELVATGGAPAVFVGEFGWYVTRVDFDATLHATRARQAWLDPAVPDDPDVAALVARAKAAMVETGEEFSTRLVASFRTQGFEGSESCASCHEQEFAVWRASGHAHAMHTLVEKKAERDPNCIACHLGDVPPAGERFAPVPLTSLGIGCETCHGGGARHADLARRGATAESTRALAKASADQCLRCHFPPNDTHFDFAQKWPKIAHSRPK